MTCTFMWDLSNRILHQFPGQTDQLAHLPTGKDDVPVTGATRIENDAYLRCPHEQCDTMWSGYGEIDWIRQSWFNGACCVRASRGTIAN